MQMFVSLNRGGVIAILPERSLLTLPMVVLLRRPSGDELHTLSNYVFARVLHQQMYMVGRDDVVEDTKPKALLRFEEPAKITAPITRKLE